MYSSPAITGLYNGILGKRYGHKRFPIGNADNRAYLAEIIGHERVCGISNKECLDYLLWLRWMGSYPVKIRRK